MQVAEGSVAEMHQHHDTDDEYQDEAVYPDSVVDPSFNTMDRLADLADEEENPTDYSVEDGDDNADVEMQQQQDYIGEVEERAEPQYIQLAPPTPLTVRRAIVSVFSIVIYIIYYKSMSSHVFK